jgi:F0F1-type ATP synthase membrane subunit c/vacuolar-type H+-ATPase subunit K
MKNYKIGLLLTVLLLSLFTVAPQIASAKWRSFYPNASTLGNVTNSSNFAYGCYVYGWNNYTIASNSTNPLDNVMNTISLNFSWFWSLAVGVIYASLYMLYSREPTRNKFIGIAFAGLIITTVFRMYALVSNSIWFSSWAILIFTFIIVRMT